ncbi:MAG: hypothetical protein K2N06_00320 [Oscillospiraceae bacterium]|nr:hypothetical protein [Oscillospiraceae bacterium]
MMRIINANFARMRKSVFFWACLAVTFAVIAGSVCMNFSLYPYVTNWEQTIQHYFYVPLFTVPAFAAEFLGTEYSNNTVRNKLIAGKTRLQIYLANLVTVTAGGLLITAAGQIVPIAVAIYAGRKGFSISEGNFAVECAICICAVIAACAVFTLIGMIVSQKSMSITLSLILMIGAYFAVSKIKEKLDVPQFDTISVYNADGTIERQYEEPRPDAATGFTRTVLETVYNLTSFGEIEQSLSDTTIRYFMPLYSFGILAVTTPAGIVIFRKKDLK